MNYDPINLISFIHCRRVTAEVGGTEAEVLTEAAAEIGTAAKAAVGSNLHDAALRVIGQKVSCIVQAHLLDIAGQFSVPATLGENGTHAFLGQLEAVHDGLSFEAGIQI